MCDADNREGVSSFSLIIEHIYFDIIHHILLKKYITFDKLFVQSLSNIMA